MNGNLKLRFSVYEVLLIILIFWVVISSLIWTKIDTLPPQGNALQDLFPGINFYLDVIHGRVTLLGIADDYIRNTFYIYPPLTPVSYALTYFLFGPDSKMESIINSLYLGMALFSVYGICRKFFNAKTGLLAAFILSSFPGIISLLKYIYAEFHLMCFVALTLYVLLLTDYFMNRKYSLLLGVCLGLTALVKWEFPPGLIGPIAVTLWGLNRISRKGYITQEQKRICRVNFLLFISIGVLISLFWYVPSLKDIVWRLFLRKDENIFINNRTTFYPKLFSMQTFTYYPLNIINFISFFYFLFLSLAVLILAYRLLFKMPCVLLGSDRYFLSFLGLWIIIPYIFFTLVKIQAPSHILLILPALAVIISAGIMNIKNKIDRITLICFIVLYGTGAYLHSFLIFKKNETLYSLKLHLMPQDRGILNTSPRYSWEIRGFYPPDNKDWKIKEILQFIRDDNFRKSKTMPLVFILGNSNITCFDFQYYNLLKNYQLYIEPRGNDRSNLPQDRSKFDYVVMIIGEEMIIDKDRLIELIKMTPNIFVEGYRLDDFERDFFQKYRLIEEFTLPCNKKCKIYEMCGRYL